MILLHIPNKEDVNGEIESEGYTYKNKETCQSEEKRSQTEKMLRLWQVSLNEFYAYRNQTKD